MLSARSPRNSTLMFVKMLLGPLRPSQSQFHRRAHPLPLRRKLRALIKRHKDVRPQPDLGLDRALRTEKMRRPIQMRAKRHPLFVHFPQFSETENLEPARVGEDGTVPGHKPVQPAHPPHSVHARPQIKMVGIPQQNLYPEIFEQVLRYAFDRSQRPHRHKHRSFDDPMRRDQPAEPARAVAGLNLESDRHCVDCKRKSGAPLLGLLRALGGYLSRVRGGSTCLSRLTISPRTEPFSITNFPTVTGNLKRRGPALPGLK